MKVPNWKHHLKKSKRGHSNLKGSKTSKSKNKKHLRETQRCFFNVGIYT